MFAFDAEFGGFVLPEQFEVDAIDQKEVLRRVLLTLTVKVFAEADIESPVSAAADFKSAASVISLVFIARTPLWEAVKGYWLRACQVLMYSWLVVRPAQSP